MMIQYFEIKDEHKDCLLFFRLGDFYELFFEDALTASRELEIALTGRNCGLEEKAPMCGVPYHSVDGYIVRLVEKGYKVALCEQVEDPADAVGIVKRAVTRIITPGTMIDTSALDDSKNNYIACIVQVGDLYGVSFADVTTGDFVVTELSEPNSAQKLMDEMAKFSPAECIVSAGVYEDTDLVEELGNRFRIRVEAYADWHFEYSSASKKILEHLKLITLASIGLEDMRAGTSAAGALLYYLYELQKSDLKHMGKIIPYYTGSYMNLDVSTRRNLELTETLREKKRKGSLLWVLDKTKTAMGARMIRKYIEQPLVNKENINFRLDAVECFLNSPIERSDIQDLLTQIYDFERLMSKVIYGSINAKDMLSLKNSIGMLPKIKEILKTLDNQYSNRLVTNLDTLEDIYDLLNRSIYEEPPFTLRDGNLIKAGYNDEVDELRLAKTEGTTWIAQIEAKEKEKTNIKTLKIKYNRIFGYFIEVTNSNLDLVPDYYIRKQTLSNAERYITEELKEVEDKVLKADDKIVVVEYNLFVEIRNIIASNIERIQQSARDVADLDTLLSLALVAEEQHFVKPTITEEDGINIKNGRHPVVEKMMKSNAFISNDTILDEADNQLVVITGPNMSGKSTYMRQVALIVLMAQIGSFIPADQAEIGIVDRIFTRVGASDDLASGQSTFMVEMTEVSNILHHATKKSLLILDEIGRGTSTFDGLSIAWAVIEHIADSNLLGAKTLFATHYHELTELEEKIPGIKNYCIAIKEQGDDIIFLRKIKRGGADHSYGIQVAQLAGLPLPIIGRAKEILAQLDDADITKSTKTLLEPGKPVEASKPSKQAKVTNMQVKDQITLFNQNKFDPVIDNIKDLNILGITPMEAMQILYDLQQKVKKLS
ncbi:MAG TPA: DNA mismatch repair protein MutS [Epulopiscium sp.]|nr:DNA mismatch repair protein MutS [Candidatus Epulonipiscium sp.]